MRMQKGICIELDGDRSVYMLSDGRFVTGKPQDGTVVGTEAYFEAATTGKQLRLKWVALPLIAAFAVLLLTISTFILPEQEAYGYVQVESNPGIEIGVDEKWMVISLRDLNMDGKKLIERLDPWEDQSLETVLQQVLNLSVDNETEQVTITTVQEEGDTETVTTVEQITLAAVFANAGGKLKVHMKEANKTQWREAKKQQVPVAQLIEKDRIFTSPDVQDNDVQPAQNEGKQSEKTDEKEQSDQTEPATTEKPDAPSGETQKKSPAPPKINEVKKTPVPAKPTTPSAPNGNIKKEPKPTPEVPAVEKKQSNAPTKKQENEAGSKGDSPVESKTAPAKKPADASQGKGQENKAGKEPKQDKPDTNGNNNSKEKSKGGGADKPAKNAADKVTGNQNSSKPGTGKGTENKEKPLPEQATEKNKAPNAANKTKKDSE